MDDQITGGLVERDGKGRFVKGHRKTGGRAKRATEIEYLTAVLEGIPLDDVTTGARRLADKIRKGDIYAWKLLLPYLVGLPTQRMEHTGADGAGLRIEVIYADDSGDGSQER